MVALAVVAVDKEHLAKGIMEELQTELLQVLVEEALVRQVETIQTVALMELAHPEALEQHLQFLEHL